MRDTCSPHETALAEAIAALEALTRTGGPDLMEPVFELNLTIRQLKVFFAIGQDETHSAHELADKMAVSIATMTGIVDRLVAVDLVQRREDAKDRRVRRHELTGHGRQLLQGMFDNRMKGLRSLLAELDVDELRQLGHLAQRVQGITLRQRAR
jgi:DNA-binding MarR family transcriptional regulator